MFPYITVAVNKKFPFCSRTTIILRCIPILFRYRFFHRPNPILENSGSVFDPSYGPFFSTERKLFIDHYCMSAHIVMSCVPVIYIGPNNVLCIFLRPL